MVDVDPEAREFGVRFTGNSGFDLRFGTTQLAEIRFGLARCPRPKINLERFASTYRRVFPQADEEALAGVWNLVQLTAGAGHGALLVVSSDADAEATLLSRQSTLVDPQPMPSDLVARVTSIDGALLLNPAGDCYAVGVILDGEASASGSPSRGARFNAAIRYVNSNAGRLAVVVSEDGYIDLIPRLRPQISRSDFSTILRQVESHETADSSAGLPKLVRTYWDFLPEDAAEMAHEHHLYLRGVDMFDDLEVWEVFDAHESDIVDELPTTSPTTCP